ncbi:hypothetical protein PAHAL_9G528900 [Panicum hallii]|uniref:Uncharacterized protein n=1 Tax=Panicum hallii TaxID=206008 RepID=A0A2T8I5I2_9POAL|nr:hypothetical protein PAHAL_9G528900 [Panicum hallii]
MPLNLPTFLSSQKFLAMTFERSYISFKPEVPIHTREVGGPKSCHGVPSRSLINLEMNICDWRSQSP